MLICCQCHREPRCEKNRAGADFGRGHIYPADRFICDTCGWTILNTIAVSIFDPQHQTQDEYLTMKTNAAQEAA